MSCTISVSDRPEDIWIIRSELFRNFTYLLEQLEPTALSVHARLKNAVMVNGISLDAIWEENPTLALECRDVLCRAARALCDSTARLDQANGVPSVELPTHRERFGELATMLDTWRPEPPFQQSLSS